MAKKRSAYHCQKHKTKALLAFFHHHDTCYLCHSSSVTCGCVSKSKTTKSRITGNEEAEAVNVAVVLPVLVPPGPLLLLLLEDEDDDDKEEDDPSLPTLAILYLPKRIEANKVLSY